MSKARDLANAGTALTTVSATELGYLDGVTSAVQTQLNAKQATVSGVNDTEIGYLDGVTSAIQTQIDSKSGTGHLHDSTYINQSTITAKGDLIVGTGSGAYVAQGVGANGTVLTANSAQADGVEWAALPASGGMTLITSGSVSNSFSINSIPQTYKEIQIHYFGIVRSSGADFMRFQINGLSGNDYTSQHLLGGSNTVQGNSGTSAVFAGSRTGIRASGKLVFPAYTGTDAKVWYFISSVGGATNPAVSGHGSYTLETGGLTSISVTGSNISGGSYFVYGVN